MELQCTTAFSGRCVSEFRARDYVVSLHAADELEADGYTVLDLEAGILGGTILERQRDKETGESKYQIRGPAASAGEIEEVAKLSPTGKLVILTVYRPLALNSYAL